MTKKLEVIVNQVRRSVIVKKSTVLSSYVFRLFVRRLYSFYNTIIIITVYKVKQHLAKLFNVALLISKNKSALKRLKMEGLSLQNEGEIVNVQHSALTV